MDKSWINKLRSSAEYLNGVQNFVKFAFEKSEMNGNIFCPCQKCVNCSAIAPQIGEEHLVWNGFLKGYTEWIFHEEFKLSSSSN